MTPTAALVAYGDAPAATPDLHILAFGVQTGRLDLAAGALELAAVTGYLVGRRRLARRGRSWPAAHTLCFVAGVAVVWLAVGSGLAAYDEVSVTLHVVQHVLLMMVAPPLLALGKPLTLAAQTLGRSGQSRLLRAIHSPAMRVLTSPVVIGLAYLGSMYGYFLTDAYRYSIAHPFVHDASHGLFLVVGYLYWQPLVGGDPVRRPSHPVRFLAIMLGAPVEAALGVAISVRGSPLAPGNTLADSQNAGRVFLILSMLTAAVWAGLLIYQWFDHIERHTDRDDRKARAEIASSRERAEALGLGDIPPGWYVPAWRLSRDPPHEEPPPVPDV